jgi:hypothetical protein
MVTQGEGRRRVNRGDVRAQFEAHESAGLVIFIRGLFRGSGFSAVGAPPANLFEHSIRPFDLWNGRHFCESDWHLLVFAEIAPPREGESITRQEGEAVLEPRSVDLYLDGTRLTNTERTSIRQLGQAIAVDDDGNVSEVSGSGWWFQTGAFFSPGELAVGSHTFSTTTTEPGTDNFVVGPITFHIDAAGTGSCI